jgi:Fe-S-cluster containining protein
MGRSGPPRWAESPERAALRALYAEVDRLVAGWSCTCADAGAAARCCHFAVTGREPYPTAVELEEVRHGIRAAGLPAADPRKLPVIHARELGACPLLASDQRCRIYASRPFGCRTFFCDHAEAAFRRKLPRDAIQALSRRVADLSARFAPRDPGPRPLTRALRTGR